MTGPGPGPVIPSTPAQPRIYASSLMGVTGTWETVSTAASSLVRRIRATTDLPVRVGTGISIAAQAARVAGFADGVIAASALVKAILDAPDAAAGATTVAGPLDSALAAAETQVPLTCENWNWSPHAADAARTNQDTAGTIG
jgi:tryptophan synthase alpha subunit